MLHELFGRWMFTKFNQEKKKETKQHSFGCPTPGIPVSGSEACSFWNLKTLRVSNKFTLFFSLITPKNLPQNPNRSTSIRALSQPYQFQRQTEENNQKNKRQIKLIQNNINSCLEIKGNRANEELLQSNMKTLALYMGRCKASYLYEAYTVSKN